MCASAASLGDSCGPARMGGPPILLIVLVFSWAKSKSKLLRSFSGGVSTAVYCRFSGVGVLKISTPLFSIYFVSLWLAWHTALYSYCLKSANWLSYTSLFVNYLIWISFFSSCDRSGAVPVWSVSVLAASSSRIRASLMAAALLRTSSSLSVAALFT